MIAMLTGRLIRTDLTQVVIDVSGVGYLVTVSRRCLEKMQGSDDVVSLLTEMVVREDSMTLYGFMAADEQAAFRLLQSVQGVGAKAAMAILSVLAPAELHQAIMAGDKAMVTRADGVGPKLAQRIVNELAEKVGAVMSAAGTAGTITGSAAGKDGAGSADAGAAQTSHIEAALSALVNLGYGRAEAWQAVNDAAKAQPEASESALIGAALRTLGSRL